MFRSRSTTQPADPLPVQINSGALTTLLSQDPFRTLYLFLLPIYFAALCAVLFWPFRFTEPHSTLLADLHYEIFSSHILYIRDLIQNVIYFIPLAMMLMAVLWERRSRWLVVQVVILCTLFSLVVEVTQHWMPSRFSSGLDILCNFLGSLIGAVAYCLVAWYLRVRARRISTDLNRR